LWDINDNGLQMVAIGRLAIMWLSTLLAALVYRWSGELFHSKLAGLLTLLFFTFDPNVLANSYLATTDIGSAFFISLAAYLVWRYWRRESSHQKYLYVITAVAIGFALSAKFSGLILLPAIVMIAFYSLVTTRSKQVAWRRTVIEIAGWFLIAILIFFLIYHFDFTTFWQDFSLQREHQLGGNDSFILGRFGRGWWYYFPLVFVIKTPLPTLILLSIGLLLFAAQRQWSWQIVWPLLLAVAVGLAALVSRVNIGYRYLLVALPSVYVFLGQLGQPSLLRIRSLRWVLTVCLLWLLATSVWIHPHYLAYFNALAGGPNNGWNIVLDSNIDWGQDLQGLGAYLQEKEIDFVNANWLGSVPLEVYGINGRAIMNEPIETEYGLHDWFYPSRPAPGVYALSVTQLYGVLLNDRARYHWFKERPPEDKIGYSIFVYDVPPSGEQVGLALSGIGISTIRLDDFDQAFNSNDVHPRWYDARTSVLWPAGSTVGSAVTTWASIGDGHLPDHPALQALYPLSGPSRRGVGSDELAYYLFQWHGSPISERLALSSSDPSIETRFGWSPESKVSSREWDQVRLPLLEPALFGNTLELLGYEKEWDGEIPTDQSLELVSYWRLHQTPSEDLKLFVHVIDTEGEVVAQHDALDVLTDGLKPGDELAQLHTIPLQDGLPSGEYGLQIGVYRKSDFTRLPVATVDRLLLDSFVLE